MCSRSQCGTVSAASVPVARGTARLSRTPSLMPHYWKVIAKFSQLAAAAAVPRRAGGVSSLGWTVLSLGSSLSARHFLLLLL